MPSAISLKRTETPRQNLTTTNPGKSQSDFVTFFATTKGADIGARCSIRLYGLTAAIFRNAELSRLVIRSCSLPESTPSTLELARH